MGILLRLALVATIAALLVFGIASCGEDDDSGSAANGDTAAKSRPGGSQAGGDGSGEARESPEPGDEGSTAAQKPLPPHEDSEGRSAEFRAPGGDNSIPNYGSERTGTEFDEAVAALHGFLDGRAVSDWTTACKFLSSEIVEGLRRLAATRSEELRDAGCPPLLEALAGRVPVAARRAAAIADVRGMRVEGERGFLLYRGYGGEPYAISMIKENGRWKVAGLAGVPLS